MLLYCNLILYCTMINCPIQCAQLKCAYSNVVAFIHIEPTHRTQDQMHPTKEREGAVTKNRESTFWRKFLVDNGFSQMHPCIVDIHLHHKCISRVQIHQPSEQEQVSEHSKQNQCKNFSYVAELH